MTRKRRPPFSIRLFAVAFLLAALVAFLGDITHLDATIAMLEANTTGLGWTRDMAIVAISARLSIAVIPIALVWFLASGFARWMVVLMSLGKLINVPAAIEAWQTGGTPGAYFMMSNLLAYFAVACLFAPGARLWFNTSGGDDAQVFD